MVSISDITEGDAFNIIVDNLRNEPKTCQRYGYELYMPNIIRNYIRSLGITDEHEVHPHIAPISPIFYNTAWEMCRRGILRPGIAKYGSQATDDGSGGNGYSITNLGREWLKEAGQYDYIPTEPGRFSKLLDRYSPKYGPVFRERSQEAIKCYGYTAYLACCVMCGAAAESIILSVAISKTSDEDEIIKLFSTPGGRKKVENLIIGQKPRPIQDEFLGYSSLLKYWRDISAHGKTSGISNIEAYTSLALLLRFAQFVTDKWEDFTE